MLAKEMDDFSLPAFYSRIYSLAPLVKRTTMDIVCLFVRSFALLLLLQLFGHFGDKFIALIKYRKLLPISKKSQFSEQNGSTFWNSFAHVRQDDIRCFSCIRNIVANFFFLQQEAFQMHAAALNLKKKTEIKFCGTMQI